MEKIMEARYDVKTIINYIIAYSNDCELEITNLVVQKILYYIQGYFIKINNALAFDSDIYKWPYGPVVPTAYFELCANRNQPIYFEKSEREKYLEDTTINRKDRNLINTIIKKCNSLGVTQLVNGTHNQLPWKNAEMKKMIQIESIIDYFEENNPIEI